MNTENLGWMEKMAGFNDGVDYVEVKSDVGSISLREFVAGVLSYQPGWMQMLYRIRTWLLRLLGQGRQGISEKVQFSPERIPIHPGESATFFTVDDSDGETYWIATGKDRHLDATIGVVVEPIEGESVLRRYSLVTLVKYKNWAGPVYFTLIKPFHHIVVYCVMKSVLFTKNAQ
ncbi:DUF2867 domain-containing protein [Pseudodesulfovibrio sediminis]|uniref:DUF2867 domain-containing protein n=1 Tax=Pseudodesulfovibrio sediminis TaxID=2810563 RepID=A0ABN6ERI8_9BACT|nr:DUF2867 domain-containing protein [Pseudodesulfovibrio sediminis]BCS89007.1 hypothetical protein PSDVSF_22490 [Pseudodesulfovibrio sediminis]